MMLAQGVKLDVFHQNNFTRIGSEDRMVYDLFDTLPIPLREKFHCPRRTRRRPHQSFSRRIFADGVEQIAVSFRQLSELASRQRLGMTRQSVLGFNFRVMNSQD